MALILKVYKMITLTLKHGYNENTISSVLSTIEDICEEVDCNMVWGSSTPKTISWNFFSRNDQHEECIRTMLLNLAQDYPYYVTVN